MKELNVGDICELKILVSVAKKNLEEKLKQRAEITAQYNDENDSDGFFRKLSERVVEDDKKTIEIYNNLLAKLN